MTTLTRTSALLALLSAALCNGGAHAGSPIEPLRNGAGPESWLGELSPISPEEWTYERAAHLLDPATMTTLTTILGTLRSLGRCTGQGTTWLQSGGCLEGWPWTPARRPPHTCGPEQGAHG